MAAANRCRAVRLPSRRGVRDDELHMTNARIRIEYVGNAAAPVLVIDDFIPEAQSLIDFAAANDRFTESSKFYPGVRMTAPLRYVELTCELLRAPLAMAFGEAATIEPTESSFSLVTKRPEQLIPFQRLPHFDGTDPQQLAVLHYLGSAAQGGTAFYRHRSTRLEVITSDCVQRYVNAVNAEVAAIGTLPTRYVSDGEPLFERIASFDAAFNRVLVYAGTSLHSGAIPPDFLPDRNPRTGRLTVNTFLRYPASGRR